MKRQVKWGKLLAFIFSLIIVVNDILNLTILSWTRGLQAQWTIFGFISFIVSISYIFYVIDSARPQESRVQ